MQVLKRSWMITVALVPACAVPSADDVASAASDLRTKDAVYSVPVPSALASAASFPVRNLRWSANSAEARLAYDAPLALTGLRQRVDLRGPRDPASGTYRLVGAAGTATCVVNGGVLACDERLDGLVVDKSKALASAGPDVDLAQRESVLDIFGPDPIGILTARVRASRPAGDDD